MGRPLIHILIALIPLFLYWVFVRFVRKKEKETGGRFDANPYIWMLIIGLVVSGGSLIAWRLLDPGERGNYIPSQVIDGEVVPGRIE